MKMSINEALNYLTKNGYVAESLEDDRIKVNAAEDDAFIESDKMADREVYDDTETIEITGKPGVFNYIYDMLEESITDFDDPESTLSKEYGINADDISVVMEQFVKSDIE